MARLAIARGFLVEHAKLERGVQTAVQAMITEFAGHEYTGYRNQPVNEEFCTGTRQWTSSARSSQQ